MRLALAAGPRGAAFVVSPTPIHCLLGTLGFGGTYRVVGRRGHHAHGRGAGGGARARRQRVQRGHEELRGAGADEDVVPVDGGVADQPVQPPHLVVQARLQEPAHVADVREVAHGLPPRDDDLGGGPRPPPELLEHGRVAAAPDNANVKAIVYNSANPQQW